MTTETFQILNRIAKAEKRMQKNATECLCPSCKRKAIRSHALQKNGWLSGIAEEGHVMGVQRQIAAPLFKASPESPPVPGIERLGLNEASTFWGYCNQHDTQLFDCIERQPLCRGDVKQVMAFHLRAMSFERVAKQMQQDVSRCLATTEIEMQRHEFLENEIRIKDRLLEADSRYRWNLFWMDSKIANFEDEYRFRWLVIPKNFGVAAVTMVPPMSAIMEDRYMTAHKHRDGSYDVGRPSFSLSVIPYGQETHVVMCWHEEDNDFVASWERELCSGDTHRMTHFLNLCIFGKSEDYYIRPSLWYALPGVIRDRVCCSLLLSCEVDEPPAVISI